MSELKMDKSSYDMYDLHLIGNCEENLLKSSLQAASRLGYGIVAIGYKYPVQDKQGGDKNKAKLPSAPPSLSLDSHSKESTGVRSKGLKQVSRLNLVLSDGSDTHKLREDNIKSYQLLAVQPTTEKMFHMACTKLEVDIISVDLTEKLPFYFKRVALNAAVERGVYFEIPYAPVIRDSTLRKNVLLNATTLVTLCAGKNLIITSQAIKPLEIRGPYDIANLGLLFGLTEQEAKNAVSTNCRAVMYHAATRRNTIKSVMSLQSVGELTSQERWKVQHGLEARGLITESGIEGGMGGDDGEAWTDQESSKKRKSDSVSASGSPSKKKKTKRATGVD